MKERLFRKRLALVRAWQLTEPQTELETKHGPVSADAGEWVVIDLDGLPVVWTDKDFRHAFVEYEDPEPAREVFP